jgi:hypothetical protein
MDAFSASLRPYLASFPEDDIVAERSVGEEVEHHIGRAEADVFVFIPPVTADSATTDVTHSLIVNPIDLMHVAAERQLDVWVAEKEVLELLDVRNHPAIRHDVFAFGLHLRLEQAGHGQDGCMRDQGDRAGRLVQLALEPLKLRVVDPAAIGMERVEEL